MILSILTPTLPSRLGMMPLLTRPIENQIGSLPVEHLYFGDNKRRTVGEKRDALLRIARGKYVAFVDDDDWVASDYIVEVMKAAALNPDVITFHQHATINDQMGWIQFKLGNPNEAFQPNKCVRRNAWHVCLWRREIAICSSFPAINYGEDWAYASKLCALPNLREVHIPKVLHYYRHSSEKTEAPPPS